MRWCLRRSRNCNSLSTAQSMMKDSAAAAGPEIGAPHSESDSTTESPRRSTRYWEASGPPRAPGPECWHAFLRCHVCSNRLGVSETRNPETRNLQPPWSADSSPGSPPIVEPQTGFGDYPPPIRQPNTDRSSTISNGGNYNYFNYLWRF